MAVSLSLLAGAGWQFFNNNGTPLSGGNLYTYTAGTTTPTNTYTSASGAVANTNPIVLDSAGRVPYEIWLTAGTNYKFVLKTSAGVTLGTYDDIKSASTSLDGTGTNNGVAYFNSVGAFSSGTSLTFNSATSALTVGGNVTCNAVTASGNVVTTGNVTASGNLSGVNLTATGTAAITGNTTITGTIASTGGITSSTPAVTQSIGDNSTKIATTAFVQASLQSSKIQPLTAIVSSNQLVITLAPTSLSFRDPSAINGATVTIANSSNLTLTVPTAATLGTTTNTLARLVILAVKNGANMELAITNLAGGSQLDEANTITTSNAAATSTTSVYCANNLTSTVYRVVGFIDATYLTTIPGWSSLSLVQGAGGQALAALSSFGFGQTFAVLSPVSGTTYYNTSGKPILVSFLTITSSSATQNVLCQINGTTVYRYAAVQGFSETAGVFFIPAGASYNIQWNTNTPTFYKLG
jgi:hypothetical protein